MMQQQNYDRTVCARNDYGSYRYVQWRFYGGAIYCTPRFWLCTPV